MTSRIVGWMLALPCLALLAFASGSPHATALEVYDAAWRLAGETHFDPAHGGLDWDAVGAALRPRAAAARDTAELRDTIGALLAQLHSSHFQLVPEGSEAALAFAGTSGQPPAWSERVIGTGTLTVGVLAFAGWTRAQQPALDRALVALRGCDALVLDLRGNAGGESRLTLALAGHFFARATVVGSVRTRDGVHPWTVLPRGNPAGWHVEPYLGPLAVLVDERSASSTELFAGGLQSVGRARVFGTRTAGAALLADLDPLPNGDALLHAVGEFATADGTVLEGRGVEPDEVVERAPEDLVADRDPVLEAALRWARARRGTPSASE